MTDCELERALVDKKAVVVHFSNYADTGRNLEFPGDLRWAIENCAHKALSCSVLYPGQVINPVGSVGIMFAPKVAHVLSVCNEDSGSSIDVDGNEQM